MNEEQAAAKAKRKKIAIAVAAALLVLFLAGIIFRLHGQRVKQAELNDQILKLEDKVNELMREKERLQSDLEFTKSLEGLLQYARDNLGYKLPDDIRIDDGE